MFPTPSRTFMICLSLCTVMAFCTVMVSPAFAQIEPDDIGFDLAAVGQVRGEKPQIILTPSINVSRIHIKLQRNDGKEITLKSGGIRSGRTKKIAIPQGKGIYSYRCALSGKAGKASFGPFKLEFEIKVGEPPRIAVSPADVDEVKRTITVRLTEPEGKIDLTVWGDDGEIIDELSHPYKQAPGTPITVPWSQKPTEVMGRFELKAWDVVGFWSGLRSVTFMNIPHEDVVFESGKHEIRASEERKLIEPLGRIHAELQKVKGVLPITLYIGGYTDTVGSAADNLALSRRRAKAIGQWFRKRGIRVPIKVQGFGESVLFVQTPDNTDEARNRRASYVLSAAPPPANRGFPTRSWNMIP